MEVPEVAAVAVAPVAVAEAQAAPEEAPVADGPVGIWADTIPVPRCTIVHPCTITT